MVYLCLVLLVGMLFYASKVGQLNDRRRMGNAKQDSKRKDSGSPGTLALSTQERIELLANVILDKILAEKNKSSEQKG
jgi:hypothetical protein